MRSVFFDRYGMLRFPWVLTLIGLGVVVVMGVVGVVMLRLGESSCNRKADLMQTEGRFEFRAGGCFLRLDDGRYVPADLYRVTDGVRQGGAR